jgi:hypothetical protein
MIVDRTSEEDTLKNSQGPHARSAWQLRHSPAVDAPKPAAERHHCFAPPDPIATPYPEARLPLRFAAGSNRAASLFQPLQR